MRRRRNTIRPARRITSELARNTEDLEVSGNARDKGQGLAGVVSVRMDARLLKRLDALVQVRAAVRSWPRVTRSTVIVEAVKRELSL